MEHQKKIPKPSVHFTIELFHDICTDIASGMSLQKACREPGRPDKKNVWIWMRDDDLRPEADRLGLRTFYARAVEERTEAFLEDIIEISDSAPIDFPAGVQAARLMVDTRKWAMAQMKPRKYGRQSAQDDADKGDITIHGGLSDD